MMLPDFSQEDFIHFEIDLVLKKSTFMWGLGKKEKGKP